MIPMLFKLDTAACHLINVSPPWFKVVLARRSAAEMSPATCYIYFDVIRNNNEDFFLKTYLRFLMTLERVNSVMTLHIHKIIFLREMSLNLTKIALI